MAGLVAPAPNADPAGAEIAADGWFPPVKLEDIRAEIRAGNSTITTERLTAAIEGAMLTGLRELARWRAARIGEGAANLAQVTADQLNGKNRAELLWQRIVRYYAAAELVDGHRDISATEEGLQRSEEQLETADSYRRSAHDAVADLRSIGADAPAPRQRVTLL